MIGRHRKVPALSELQKAIQSIDNSTAVGSNGILLGLESDDLRRRAGVRFDNRILVGYILMHGLLGTYISCHRFDERTAHSQMKNLPCREQRFSFTIFPEVV